MPWLLPGLLEICVIVDTDDEVHNPDISQIDARPHLSID